MTVPSDSGRRPPAKGSLFPDLGFEAPPPPRPQREPKGAAQWVAHVREQDMPAFGATVALVHSVTEDDKASTGRLAQVILQDAAMTTKVLKLANSAYYNPSRQSISTISRAIVVLGFNVVAEIAVGVMLVDALLAGGVRDRVVAEMAISFHAAVQARAAAQMRGDSHSEEVFIAALLMRVGEMAFWCFGGNTAERLDKLIAEGGVSEDEAQQAELGFRLHQLSLGLVREWKLGSLLQGVLEGGSRLGPAEQAIRLGHQIARAAIGGWDSPGSRKALQDVADFVQEPLETVAPCLVANAEEAARIAACYGAVEAARGIPLAGKQNHETVLAEAGSEDKAEADPMLQLKILRELSGRIAAGASLNEILQLVLEGIFRGVGFDRVLFGLLAPNRRQLVAKTGLGLGADALCKRFVFSLGSGPGDLIDELFLQPRALRLAPGAAAQDRRADRLVQVVGVAPACLAPILANGRPIGLFYADRSGGDAIDDESFDAFQLFVQQVSLAVSRVAASGR